MNSEREIITLEDVKKGNYVSSLKKEHKLDLTKNIIQFRNKFVNLTDSGCDNSQMAVSTAAELMQLGYFLDKSAIDNLSSASEEEIIKFHNEVIEYVKIMSGADKMHKPFWKGFPQEVMEKSEVELWIYQMAHYSSNGSFIPNEFHKTRKTAFERVSYTTISSGNEERFLKIFTDLVSVNNSLSPDDMDIVIWFISNNIKLTFPETIPFKETLAILASMGLNVPIKSVTDILRIASYMSGGDTSLPRVPQKIIRENAWTTKRIENPERESFNFKKFSRKERRFILNLLESTNCDSSEAVLKSNRWIRLGEIIHPGEYKTKFPKAFEMFNKIRNEKVDSWYSKVNKSFDKSFEEGLKKLSERPGEFYRRLDALVRKNSDKKSIIFKYMKFCSENVSNKVMFETMEHFEKRKNPSRNRTIMIKGSRKITKLKDLESLSEHTIKTINSTIIKSLSDKFSKLSELGSVWVDEELKNIPMPKNMRSISSSLKPTIRGQRTKVANDDAKVIRAFVHWYDELGNEDIDLSCTFIGDDKIKIINFHQNLSCEEACHSNDIRYVQGACAEYIDINLEKSLKNGYNYAVIDARNYNGRSFETVKDCVAGYMTREFPVAEEIFVPKTIDGCTRLTNEATNTIVSVIDLRTREVIHLDVDTDGIPIASANIQEILDAIEPYCQPPAFSVHDLVMMHVNSRGGVISSLEDAETTFEYKDFSDSYIETLKLMGI